MDLSDSQYRSGLRLMKGAEVAVLSVVNNLKRQEEQSRLRRGIEEIETILKKVKRELRIG